jgi:hypothetical protein
MQNPSPQFLTSNSVAGRAYLNGVLTVIACLLAVHVASSGAGLSSAASAQVAGTRGSDRGGDKVGFIGAGDEGGEGGSSGLVSAADQRKQILAELQRIGSKLDAVDAALNKGLNVKVTDMPAMKLPAADKAEQTK